MSHLHTLRGPQTLPWACPRVQGALTQKLLVLLDLGADVRQPSGLLWPHGHTVGHALHLLDGFEPGEGIGRGLEWRWAAMPFSARQHRASPALLPLFLREGLAPHGHVLLVLHQPQQG